MTKNNLNMDKCFLSHLCHWVWCNMLPLSDESTWDLLCYYFVQLLCRPLRASERAIERARPIGRALCAKQSAHISTSNNAHPNDELPVTCIRLTHWERNQVLIRSNKSKWGSPLNRWVARGKCSTVCCQCQLLRAATSRPIRPIDVAIDLTKESLAKSARTSVKLSAIRLIATDASDSIG